MSKKQQIKNIAAIADYQQVFNSDKGQKVLFDLMKRHGVLRISMSEDPYVTAFNEGQRAVVLEILKKLKLDVVQLHKQIMADDDSEGEEDV